MPEVEGKKPTSSKVLLSYFFFPRQVFFLRQTWSMLSRTKLGVYKRHYFKRFRCSEKCEKVYIEVYTSHLSFGISTDSFSTLEKLYGKAIILVDREMAEEKVNNILSEVHGSDVVFLVVRDPFGATTHTNLVVRAKALGVNVKVVHNASVMNAIKIF